MITECYIKGRFDYGVGKCAVVITEDVPKDKEKQVLHQVAWNVPKSWEYNGETVVADQFNCEILAATYALQWCLKNKKPIVNIYANTTTCHKWYLRMEFPESRSVMAKAYCQALEDYCCGMDGEEGKQINDRVFVEYIKKDDKNVWNWLVNDIALHVK